MLWSMQLELPGSTNSLRASSPDPMVVVSESQGKVKKEKDEVRKTSNGAFSPTSHVPLASVAEIVEDQGERMEEEKEEEEEEGGRESSSPYLVG